MANQTKDQPKLKRAKLLQSDVVPTQYSMECESVIEYQRVPDGLWATQTSIETEKDAWKISNLNQRFEHLGHQNEFWMNKVLRNSKVTPVIENIESSRSIALSIMPLIYHEEENKFFSPQHVLYYLIHHDLFQPDESIIKFILNVDDKDDDDVVMKEFDLSQSFHDDDMEALLDSKLSLIQQEHGYDDFTFTVDIVFEIDMLVEEFECSGGEDELIDDVLAFDEDEEPVKRYLIWNFFEQDFEMIEYGITLSDIKNQMDGSRHDKEKRQMIEEKLRCCFDINSVHARSNHHYSSSSSSTTLTTTSSVGEEVGMRDVILRQRPDIACLLLDHIFQLYYESQPQVTYVEMAISTSKLCKIHFLKVLNWLQSDPSQDFLIADVGDDEADDLYEQSQLLPMRLYLREHNQAMKDRYKFLASVNLNHDNLSQAASVSFASTVSTSSADGDGNKREKLKEFIDVVFPSSSPHQHAQQDDEKDDIELKDLASLKSTLDQAMTLDSSKRLKDLIVGLDIHASSFDELQILACCIQSLMMFTNDYQHHNHRFGIYFHVHDDIEVNSHVMRPRSKGLFDFTQKTLMMMICLLKICCELNQKNIRVGYGVEFGRIIHDELYLKDVEMKARDKESYSMLCGVGLVWKEIRPYVVVVINRTHEYLKKHEDYADNIMEHLLKESKEHGFYLTFSLMNESYTIDQHEHILNAFHDILMPEHSDVSYVEGSDRFESMKRFSTERLDFHADYSGNHLEYETSVILTKLLSGSLA